MSNNKSNTNSNTRRVVFQRSIAGWVTTAALVVLLALSIIRPSVAFLGVAPSVRVPSSSLGGGRSSSSSSSLLATSLTKPQDKKNGLLSLTLSKPLGLILEEREDGGGVFVQEFAQAGSALAYKSQIRGATLARVGATNVTHSDLDTIMELIMAAQDTVELEFVNLQPEIIVEYNVGTKITITVQQQGKDLELQAAVGDNLRQVLLDNGVEVYQGLKQKLGNCGGAGQCTFCAVDFLTSEGWAERSEYEDKKLARFPSARLACLNNIQGPATIRKTER